MCLCGFSCSRASKASAEVRAALPSAATLRFLARPRGKIMRHSEPNGEGTAALPPFCAALRGADGGSASYEGRPVRLPPRFRPPRFRPERAITLDAPPAVRPEQRRPVPHWLGHRTRPLGRRRASPTRRLGDSATPKRLWRALSSALPRRPPALERFDELEFLSLGNTVQSAALAAAKLQLHLAGEAEEGPECLLRSAPASVRSKVATGARFSAHVLEVLHSPNLPPSTRMKAVGARAFRAPSAHVRQDQAYELLRCLPRVLGVLGTSSLGGVWVPLLGVCQLLVRIRTTPKLHTQSRALRQLSNASCAREKHSRNSQ